MSEFTIFLAYNLIGKKINESNINFLTYDDRILLCELDKIETCNELVNIELKFKVITIKPFDYFSIKSIGVRKGKVIITPTISPKLKLFIDQFLKK